MTPLIPVSANKSSPLKNMKYAFSYTMDNHNDTNLVLPNYKYFASLKPTATGCWLMKNPITKTKASDAGWKTYDDIFTNSDKEEDIINTINDKLDAINKKAVVNVAMTFN